MNSPSREPEHPPAPLEKAQLPDGQLEPTADPAAFLERVMSSISRRTGPAYEHYHKLRQHSDRVFSLQREEVQLQSVIREAQIRLATVEADLSASRAELEKCNANPPELKPEDLVDLSEAHKVVLEKMQQVLRHSGRG